jgi:hypothetical protein
MTSLRLVAAAIATLAGTAAGSPIDAEFGVPSLDRWMYPFNQSPGAELVAHTFGALGLGGFDDRDSQFIVGFETADAIEAGLGAGAYRITSARLKVTMAAGDIAYDPTTDALETYLDPEDPAYIEDSDAGRPVDLFGLGYRNGESLETFTEFSEFGGEPIIPPAEGARNAFAAELDAQGNATTDASRNVRLGFEVHPMAAATTDAVEPGQVVPADTEFTFDIDLCNPANAAYLAASLNAGKINLAITSLHNAEQGGDPTYPSWYTKENPLAQDPFDRTAKLEITVVVDDDADLNGDGVKDLFDFLAFTNLFNAQDPIADFAQDCQYDLFDFLAFVNAFNK